MNRCSGKAPNRIENLNIIRAVSTFLFKRETRRTGLKLMGTIIRTFFIPQYQGRLGIKKRQIVNVDHELDKLIPFSADYLRIYMSFTPNWIKSIYFIYLEFGNKSLPLIRQFIDDIEKLYRIGFEVSDKCQSTTTRPGSGKNIPLKLMHLVDPHLHCVPSLHVMIVCYNHIRINELIKIFADSPEFYAKEIEYLGDQAVRITNSILYIKQHSINCIPAGLFALSSLCTEFSDNYAFDLIEKIRKLNRNSISRIDEIYSYITTLYKKFRESAQSGSESDVLINFLLNYKNKTSAPDR